MRKHLLLLLILTIFTVYYAFAQDSVDLPPAILSLNMHPETVSLEAVENGAEEIAVSWTTANVNNRYSITFYGYQLGQWQALTDGVPLPPNGEIALRVLHPLNFGPPMFRMTIEDRANQTVADARILVLNWQTSAEPESPRIELFTSSQTVINAGFLQSRRVQIGVAWRVSGRIPNSNLVFEQIMPDGTVYNVEVWRPQLWVSSYGDSGSVRPYMPPNSDLVTLRLRVVDILTNDTLDEAQIQIAIKADAPLLFTPGPDATATAIAAPIANPSGFIFTTNATAIIQGGDVTVSWNVPNAGMVYIEQHNAGESYCGKIFHEPDVVLGPFPANGFTYVKLPMEYTDAVWFELYAFDYLPYQCGGPIRTPTAKYTIDIIPLANEQQPTQPPAPMPTATQISGGGDYFVADSSGPNGSYAAVPGRSVTIRWSIASAGQVFITSNGDIPLTGPLPSSGDLRVCPRSGGTTYSLYADGLPGEVQPRDVYIWVPPSTQYPAYQVGTDDYHNACWNK